MFGKQVLYSRFLLGVVLAMISVSSIAGSTDGANNVYLPIVINPLLPIIPDTTNVLSEATTQHLMAVSEDGSIYTFAQLTPELAAVTVGEVIVSAPTMLTPNGFLRKVTAISDTGGQVVVTTVQATLEEAIQQGEAYFMSCHQKMCRVGFWPMG